MKKLILLNLLIVSIACTNQNIDYEKLPLKSEKGNYQAVVEIPTGTNKKYEYNYQSKTFEIDKKNGKERIISFLSYPGNYGFIPSTISDKAKGGDGDAIDVVILSESMKTGDVIEIIPITMLKLIDEGEEDFKIIAVPADFDKNVLKIESLEELKKRHPQILKIIELWFLNYDADDLKSLGYTTTQETIKYIENNQKN